MQRHRPLTHQGLRPSMMPDQSVSANKQVHACLRKKGSRSLMSRLPLALGLTAAVALIFTSCIFDSAPVPMRSPGSRTTTLPTPSPSPSGPRLTGTISVTGAVQLSSTFNAFAALEVAGAQIPAPAGSSCAAYAEGFDQRAQDGGGKRFDAPEALTAKVGNQTMYVSVTMVTGYAGPQPYDSREYTSLAAYASQDVDNSSGIVTTPVTSSRHGLTTLTVSTARPRSLRLPEC